MADACLWQAFDKSYTDEIENMMKDNNINVLTNTKVKRYWVQNRSKRLNLKTAKRSLPTSLSLALA